MRRAEEGRVQGWGTGCELPRPAFSPPGPWGPGQQLEQERGEKKQALGEHRGRYPSSFCSGVMPVQVATCLPTEFEQTLKPGGVTNAGGVGDGHVVGSGRLAGAAEWGWAVNARSAGSGSVLRTGQPAEVGLPGLEVIPCGGRIGIMTGKRKQKG